MLVLPLYLLFIAPVRLTVTWDQGLTVGLRIWGIGRSWTVDLSPSRQDTPHQQFMRLIGTLLRSDKARHFLLRHVHLTQLQALLRLGLSDAARTAFFTGLLQQLARLSPRHTDLRIQPDFLASTRLQARCILFFHLGTLFITAALLLTAYVLESREHPTPHPKEA